MKVLSFLGTRLISVVVVLWGAATIAFLTLHLTPGDLVDVMLGPNSTASEAVRAAIREDLGLDQPLVIQYFSYLGRLLTGDLGVSYQQSRPVIDIIGDQIGHTLQLAAAAMALALTASVIIGVLTSGTRARVRKGISSTLELIAVSAPGFWIGLMLLVIFSFNLKIFPVSGARDWTALVLPAITMALPVTAILTQVGRNGMEASLRQPFTVTAMSRGLSEIKILSRHSLRHGAIPVITLAGFVADSLIGGAVIAETVFGRPGLGRMALTAINGKDVPGVMGVVFIF